MTFCAAIYDLPNASPRCASPTVMKSICYDYLLKHKSHYVFGFSSVSSFSAHQVVGNNRKSFSEPNSFDHDHFGSTACVIGSETMCFVFTAQF